MKEMPAVIRTLLVAAIITLFGAMIRFEVVASNVENFQQEVEKHYVKKEEFVEVKSDIKYMKEKQDKVEQKINKILQAVNK